MRLGMASSTDDETEETTTALRLELVPGQQCGSAETKSVDDHVIEKGHQDFGDYDSLSCEPLGPLVTYHCQLLDLEMEIETKNVLTNGSEHVAPVLSLNQNLEDERMTDEKQTDAHAQRTPKKLFDEDGAETLPDVTLKDYEDRNLRELARERRRIIDNQAVRRKKIAYWAFATTVDETSADSGLELLRQLEDPPSPTEPEIKVEKVNGTMNGNDGPKIFRAIPKKIGTVDSASIIENKQRLRVFWERRIMAEQEASIGSIKPAEEPDVTPPDSLNGDANEPVENPPATTHSEETPLQNGPVSPEQELKAEVTSTTETPAEESAVPTVTEVTPETSTKIMDDSQESAIDREVRMTLEREEQMKEEHSQKSVEPASDGPSDEAVQPQEDGLPNVEIISASEAAEVSAKPATEATSSDVTPAADVVPAEPEEVEPVSPPEIPIAPAPLSKEPVQTEPNPEPVEVLTNKPQIIGETYHHVTKSSPTTNKVPPVVLKNSIPSPAERTFKAESKIAIEIQEMRQREEELKKMREKAIVDSTLKPPSESNQSEGSSVHSDDSLGQSPPESLTKDNVHQVSRTISLDSVPNGQAYNIGYAYGRKDNVKVKPLVDPHESDEERPKFRSHKETPIEREIRISREREEELRKQKGLQGEAEPMESLVRPTSLGIGKSRTSATKPVGDTQRIMATSRIQQEIEEQTEREKAMRASGMIQTISQERTDSRVSRLVELANGDSKSHEKMPVSPVINNQDKTPVSPIGNSQDKTPLSPVSSISDKSASPVFSNVNGTKSASPVLNSEKVVSPSVNNMNGDKSVSPILNGNSSPVNGKMNGSVKTPSPSNSTVSSSPLKANTAGRRFSNPPPGRGVNMQRFISSKGKDVAFKTFNGNGIEKSTSLVALNNELYELKPPQVPVQNKINQRRSVAMAGPRIQEELKEMQEREEELKKQRARMLGLSQPNLSTIGTTEDDIMTNGHDEKPSLDRSSSIPNLLENGENGYSAEEEKEQEDKPVDPVIPRRRSTLIDQWEQRIQKLETKS